MDLVRSWSQLQRDFASQVPAHCEKVSRGGTISGGRRHVRGQERINGNRVAEPLRSRTVLDNAAEVVREQRSHHSSHSLREGHMRAAGNSLRDGR